ncbi:MAG: hypothetical protein HQL28_01725 [Candidatus Omnitrophica bacterium]|nr:hypothetical protein [Candidatus Omnitrophota bacterium]
MKTRTATPAKSLFTNIVQMVLIFVVLGIISFFLVSRSRPYIPPSTGASGGKGTFKTELFPVFSEEQDTEGTGGSAQEKNARYLGKDFSSLSKKTAATRKKTEKPALAGTKDTLKTVAERSSEEKNQPDKAPSQNTAAHKEKEELFVPAAAKTVTPFKQSASALSLKKLSELIKEPDISNLPIPKGAKNKLSNLSVWLRNNEDAFRKFIDLRNRLGSEKYKKVERKFAGKNIGGLTIKSSVFIYVVCLILMSLLLKIKGARGSLFPSPSFPLWTLAGCTYLNMLILLGNASLENPPGGILLALSVISSALAGIISLLSLAAFVPVPIKPAEYANRVTTAFRNKTQFIVISLINFSALTLAPGSVTFLTFIASFSLAILYFRAGAVTK